MSPYPLDSWEQYLSRGTPFYTLVLILSEHLSYYINCFKLSKRNVLDDAIWEAATMSVTIAVVGRSDVVAAYSSVAVVVDERKSFFLSYHFPAQFLQH